MSKEPERVLSATETERQADMLRLLSEHSLTPARFSVILGVTEAGVNHWVNGRRPISAPIAKMVRMFRKYPGLLAEF